NSYDRLFNELIDLFEEKKVAWSSGIQDSQGKIFIKHLSNAIWYIDPHIKLLQNHAYHMSSLFKQLATYKSGASEIWASEKCWIEIIPKIFSFTTMMRKYVEHLKKSAQLTYSIHHSTTIVHTPNKYSKLTIIIGVLNINPNYKALEMILTKKDLYKFIEKKTTHITSFHLLVFSKLRITIWSLITNNGYYIQDPKYHNKGFCFREDPPWFILAERRECKDFIGVYKCDTDDWKLLN
ncbi:1272_t:CDS:2, partial [Cetraspora pellucida]